MDKKFEEAIVQSLNIPGDQRNLTDLTPIIEFVQGLKIFKSFSSHPDVVLKIASKLELKSFFNGAYVFQEGQVGNHFYIVLDGEISIVRKKIIHAHVDISTETITLVKLSSGGYFGETALESKDGLRTASAIATKRSKILSLHADDYRNILHEFKETLKSGALEKLSSPSSFFWSLKPSELNLLASYVMIRTYSPNEVILYEKERVNCLLFISNGIVKIVKKIKKSYIDHTKNSMTKNKHKNFHFKSKSDDKNSKIDEAESDILNEWLLHEQNPSNSGSKEDSLTKNNDKIIKVIRNSFMKHIERNSKNETLDEFKPSSLDFDFLLNEKKEEKEKTEDITISVLMPGSVFGELSLLNPEIPSQIEAIAATSVEIYSFDNESLIKMGITDKKRLMNKLKEDWKYRNPPISDVEKSLKAKFAWEQEKKRILNEIKIQRKKY